jgi:HEAT repeat protein
MSISVSYRLPYLGLCLLMFGCGGDSGDKLIAQLQNPDVEIRRAAARALSQQTKVDNRGIVALTKTVADTDAEVRRLSINALGKIGPAAESSLPALITALKDPEPSLRLRAALAIQKIDPKNLKFAPVLEGAMRAGDGRILLEVGAMGKDGVWAVPTLIGLLSHESAKVRALAAQTLGRIGPAASDATAALQRILQDPNAAVHGAARDALARLQAQSAGSAR